LNYLLVLPAFGLASFSLAYSAIFAILANGRRARRGTPIPPLSGPDQDADWLVVIPALDHSDLLERCVDAALKAIDGSEAQLVVALDGRQREAIERGLRAVSRALGAQPALVRTAQEAKDSNRFLRSAKLVCIPTGEILTRRGVGGKAEALNLVLALHTQWQAEPSERARPTYVLCIDIDEALSREGFQMLREAASCYPDASLIQAPKYDLPVTGSWFGRAFSAGYAAWFHWEAGWDAGGSGQNASSYYGSMGAIKLNDFRGVETKFELATGEVVRGREIFPPHFAVEDYPFSIASLADRETVLLRRPIGFGYAPPDTLGVLALWHRWTHGNVAAARWRGVQILFGPMPSGWQRMAWIYHSASWYAYAALGLLPLALLGLMLAHGGVYKVCLALLCVAISAEWARRLVPAPLTTLRQRLLRLPVDIMLWPVGVHAIIAAWSGTTTLFSRSTPRTPGSRSLPAWVVGAYLVEALAIVEIALLATKRRDLLDGAACGLLAVPCIFGLVAVVLDSRLRLRAGC
jgi:hypothetical protein